MDQPIMNQPVFESENRERLRVVEKSFGRAGQPLSKPGRILMGEGRLMKQSRKKLQTKAFFLFNDILVYGSIILNGRWHKKQRIIPLEDIQLEDIEDSEGFEHQWMIRTPRKSFIVFAFSHKEKRAWMDHIAECQASLLQDGSHQPSTTLAQLWVPDQAACKCMRCFNNFSSTNRRHHCRNCGLLVCESCSKNRAVIAHIHPTKQLRICKLCLKKIKEKEVSRLRGDSTGKNSSEEEEVVGAFNDEEEKDLIEIHAPSNWLNSRDGTWGRMSSCEN